LLEDTCNKLNSAAPQWFNKNKENKRLKFILLF
jgi:hypothetical protein